MIDPALPGKTVLGERGHDMEFADQSDITSTTQINPYPEAPSPHVTPTSPVDTRPYRGQPHPITSTASATMPPASALKTPSLINGIARRRLATAAGTTAAPPAFQVFNRTTKRLQRDRAGSNPATSRSVDYLKDEVADRLVERLLVCCLSLNNYNL